MTDDEDETVEVIQLGGAVTLLRTGLELAKLRARSEYIAGRIDVDTFEREMERLLRKEQGL